MRFPDALKNMEVLIGETMCNATEIRMSCKKNTSRILIYNKDTFLHDYKFTCEAF